MAVPQPECPISMPTFTLDTGNKLTDPVTKSSLDKTSHYETVTVCDDPEFIKFGCGTNISAFNSDCQTVPTANLTINGRIPYCTTLASELDKVIKVVRDRIVLDLGLTDS